MRNIGKHTTAMAVAIVMASFVPDAFSATESRTTTYPSSAGSNRSSPEGQRDAGFYGERQKGWFFYNEPDETPAEELEEPEPEEKPTTEMTVTPPPEVPESPKEKNEGPPPPEALSAKWFRENIDKYRDAAWDDPTVENVQTFMYLQRYMMDRSEQFADAAQLAVMGHPVLDEENRRPTAAYASDQIDKSANRKRITVLDDLSERVGIFYFYDSTCEACAKMTSVIKNLGQTFAIIPISLDGKDLPGNPFPNFRPDDGHAEQIGVEKAPALFLAKPDTDEFVPFAQAPLALNAARQRILLSAKRIGWISDEEFNSTRPVRGLDQDVSDMMAPEDFTPDADEDNFIPQKELLERFNNAMGGPKGWMP